MYRKVFYFKLLEKNTIELDRTSTQENRDNKPAPFMGCDHTLEELTYPFRGRNFRLTDVVGKVIRESLT